MKRKTERKLIFSLGTMLIIAQLAHTTFAQTAPDDLPGPEPVPVLAPGIGAIVGGAGGAIQNPRLPRPAGGGVRGEDAAEINRIRAALWRALEQPESANLDELELRALGLHAAYSTTDTEELVALVDLVRTSH